MGFLLKNYPDAINELNLLKQTPLHLAIGHGSCVELLLRESGRKLVNLPDSGGRRPMEYALFSCLFSSRAAEDHRHDGCSNNHGDTSLNILLDADCMIPEVESWPVGDYTLKISLCDNCTRAVSAHLVGRREDLKRLAANNLPRMEATAFGLFSDSILDSNTTRVVQALEECGISVPPSLQVHGCDDDEGCHTFTSAYHILDSPLRPAILWSLGFRDLNIPNIDGLTPLMFWCERSSLRDAGYCLWLIEKGADLWTLTPDGASTIGHELYSKIGGSISPWVVNEYHHKMHIFNLTQKLWHRDPQDSCRCACSPGGCTPFVRFLQAASRPPFIDSASSLMHQLHRTINATHTSLTKFQMRSVVRYATFEMLDIRHTCCHAKPDLTFHRSRHNGELDELRQEDCFLVALLEDLTAEFEAELEQMAQEQYVNKTVSFWHDCWLPRIQNVLESIESAEIEEPDKLAAEDIGVVWDKQDSGKGKEREEDFDFGVDSDSYSESENCGYHESDWDSEIDEYDMVDTFQTMEDWTSRLNLIMLKAGLSTGR